METAQEDAVSGLTSGERNTGRVCGVALVVLFASVAFVFWFEPALAGALLAFMAVNLVFGREAAMALGSALNIPAWLMFLVNVVFSLGLGLLVYLFMVRALEERSEGWVGRLAQRSREKAERHRGPIDRWGPWGIFLIMLVPFLARPYVGALAARLGGLDLRRMLVPVVAATVVMAAVLAYSISAIISLLVGLWEGFGLATAVVLAAIGLLVTGWFYSRKHKRKGQRDRHATSA